MEPTFALPNYASAVDGITIVYLLLVIFSFICFVVLVVLIIKFLITTTRYRKFQILVLKKEHPDLAEEFENLQSKSFRHQNKSNDKD
ncbi:hypothetical protein [Mycoplasma sp. 1654_15]|uniref:hypothetical protein n=1 Tax=Mycoplasma sp. 1654_15 TaxID=2725994 RepID=UPI00144A0EAF|nr:hypothetical protein [Mycoplasma sp. 1654_15]QJB71158.1 hypothetical protein HF996_01480 [Mycoplasma sp. 1654_15]